MNIWTKVGLCNGALGTVSDFVYADGQTPPALPICVLVQFDEDYRGTFSDCKFSKMRSNLSNNPDFSKCRSEM